MHVCDFLCYVRQIKSTTTTVGICYYTVCMDTVGHTYLTLYKEHWDNIVNLHVKWFAIVYVTLHKCVKHDLLCILFLNAEVTYYLWMYETYDSFTSYIS